MEEPERRPLSSVYVVSPSPLLSPAQKYRERALTGPSTYFFSTLQHLTVSLLPARRELPGGMQRCRKLTCSLCALRESLRRSTSVSRRACSLQGLAALPLLRLALRQLAPPSALSLPLGDPQGRTATPPHNSTVTDDTFPSLQRLSESRSTPSPSSPTLARSASTSGTPQDRRSLVASGMVTTSRSVLSARSPPFPSPFPAISPRQPPPACATPAFALDEIQILEHELTCNQHRVNAGTLPFAAWRRDRGANGFLCAQNHHVRCYLRSFFLSLLLRVSGADTRFLLPPSSLLPPSRRSSPSHLLLPTHTPPFSITSRATTENHVQERPQLAPGPRARLRVDPHRSLRKQG